MVANSSAPAPHIEAASQGFETPIRTPADVGPSGPNTPFRAAAPSGNVGLTCGNAQRRHTPIGKPQLPPSPLASAPAKSPWSSRIVTDTSLSRKQPPQYEVLTTTIDRASKKASPTGASFGDYASIRAMVEDAGSIVIGFDTEFTERPHLAGLPSVQSRTIDSGRRHPLPPCGAPRMTHRRSFVEAIADPGTG